ncbi:MULTISPECIES: hypothetical protein [Bradyrhizobium]|uniref:hypothetical protein n=1 Tax=Bradyrhizobium TaxID=374 RepID=UPI001BA69108|nr:MULTISPECIES: hypothetical protein [Bradyrhizobium]MBR1166955.1 hypothetical protein [Bradyrhizobium liaoningense]UWU65953.1 hypothetical protein N2602_22110 [Bradyrhizobium sp. NC92]
MRFILALSLLITLGGVADAAQVHHTHRRHATVHSGQGMIPPGAASGFAYAPPPSAPHGATEPYFGASQGYAPGEKERFLHSVFSP